jgi:hypothetical protein
MNPYGSLAYRVVPHHVAHILAGESVAVRAVPVDAALTP